MVDFYFIWLMGIIFFGFLLSIRRKSSGRIVFLMTFLVFYTFIYTYRDISVGFDYSNYLKVYQIFEFENIADAFKKTSYMEPGYLILNAIAATLHLSEVQFQAFLAVIFSFLIFKYAIHEKEHIMMLIFSLYCIGFFFNTMNQVRSSLAAAMCMVAMTYAWDRQTKRAYLLVALACTIHTSAVVGFIIIHIIKKNIMPTIKSICVCVISALVMGTFLNKIIFFLLRFFPRYKGYFEKDKVDIFIKSGNATYVMLFFAILIFALLQKKEFDLTQSDMTTVKYNSLIWCAVIGMTISILVVSISMIQRFMTLFLFSMPLLISISLKSIKNAKNRLWWVLIIALALVGYCFVYLYLSENGMGRDGVVPYTFLT